MSFRRILIIMLPALVFSALPAGTVRAGQSPVQESETTGSGMDSDGTASGQKPGAAEDVTLRWLIYGNTYSDSDHVIAEFNKLLGEHFPGVSVELETVPLSDYTENWEMKMASNSEVDIAWIGSEVLDFEAEVNKGNLMAIDYLLNTYGSNLLEQIPEKMWNRQRRNNMTYAVPVQGPLYRRNRMLVTNKTLADRYADWESIVKVNQDSPYTAGECFHGLTEYLQNLKDNNALGSGVSYATLSRMADKGYEGLYGEESPFVIRIFDENPVVYNKYTLPSYHDYYETMAAWYQNGFIRQDAAWQADPTQEDGKISGNILFLEEAGDSKSVYSATETEYEALLGDTEGYHFISHETNRNCLVIPKTAAYPAQAMQVIDYLNSDEGEDLYRLIVNGIERQQYIKISGTSDVIARMTGEDRAYRYGLVPYTIGNAFHNYELTEGQLDTVRNNNENAVISPLEGFEPDVRMISVEMARIDRICEKYTGTLNQGSSQDWETEYYDFLQQMTDAGSVKVIREMQRQVDEFINSSDG